MELKTYFRILLRKWWIVLPAFLVTFTSTVVFTFTQVPVYQTTATFLVTPNTSLGDVKSFVNGLDILSRRPEIATTYAEVANSRSIKNQAAEELKLSSEQKESLSVESQLQAGTNMVIITVEGNDPTLVRDFANTIGAQTVAYVQELYEAYELRLLDNATLPRIPIKPDLKLNLALGAILGLALGGGLTFLSEYLQTPLENVANFGILDPQTGVYNKRYFMQRLKEELSRAGRNTYPLSLALMKIDCFGGVNSSSAPISGEALHKVATLLKKYLREEDVMARFNETVFAFLLPDTPGEKAQEVMERLQTRITWTPFEMEKSDVQLNLSGVAGVVTYQYNGTGYDELLAKAQQALEEAEISGYEKIYLLLEHEEHH